MAEARNKADDIDDINRRISSRNTRPATISDSHLEILGKKGFAHLASLGPDGEPQSHPVWFDFDAAHGRLLVSTGTDRQKYRNIQGIRGFRYRSSIPTTPIATWKSAAASSRSSRIRERTSWISWRASTWIWTPTPTSRGGMCSG